MPESGPLSFEARLLLRSGLWLGAWAALACVWELLTLQLPDSPLHVGVLAGPVAQLRSTSFGLGLGAAVLALVWSKLFAPGGGRLWAWAFLLGALLQVLALTYAASCGVMGVQFFDPRFDARMVVYLRSAGHVLVLLSAVAIAARSVRFTQA